MSRSGRRASSRFSYAVDESLLYNLSLEHSVVSSTGSCHGTVSPDLENHEPGYPDHPKHVLDSPEFQAPDLSGISDVSSFNPSEVFQSTQNIDNDLSQNLPRLRESAKKYQPGRWSPKRPDYYINTSAIGQHFADFSQGGSSDRSVSIELPRGDRPTLSKPTTNGPDYSKSISSSPFINSLTSPKPQAAKDITPQAAKNLSPQVEKILTQNAKNLNPQGVKSITSQSPPKSNSRNPKNVTSQKESHKENIPPSAKSSTSPYTSHASRTVSGKRKTFAELHARVTDGSETSFIGEERPSTITLQQKTSRFHNPNSMAHRKVSASGVSASVVFAADTQQTQFDYDFDVSHQMKIPKPVQETQKPVYQPPSPTHSTPTTRTFFLQTIPEVSLNTSPSLGEALVVAQGRLVQTQTKPEIRNPHGSVGGIDASLEEENIWEAFAESKRRVAHLESENKAAEACIVSLKDLVEQVGASNKKLTEQINASNERLKEALDKQELRWTTQFEEYMALHGTNAQVNQPNISREMENLNVIEKDRNEANFDICHTQHTQNVRQSAQNASQYTQHIQNVHLYTRDADDTQNTQLTRISQNGTVQSHSQKTQNSVHPTLSAAARQVLDGLCEHNQRNCSICSRIISSKATFTPKNIPDLIPVSQRMPVTEPYTDEHTLRPSQPPRRALAVVINGLEEEIERLKTDCALLQAAYDKHDASLGKRQRKAMKAGIQQRMDLADRKMDQLYDLYDVLEGL